MLISPPFLPPLGNLTDAAWLDLAMAPSSDASLWLAPEHACVRAIADGVIAYLRRADDGCIIIGHDSEIGHGARVRYFSVYQQLVEIPAALALGQPVYRKDSLGRAADLHGQSAIACDVICDDQNLVKLVGRADGNVPGTAHGRRDALYGDVYFRLPRGSAIFASVGASAAAYTTRETLYIGIAYDGDAHVTTYQEDGRTVGAPLQEPECEYMLYQLAADLQTRCPSAAYELLRFGRSIGPDVLSPANTPHWRRISYPGGQGWVNLAPDAIRKFSDADFPQWRGWALGDASTDVQQKTIQKKPTGLRFWADAKLGIDANHWHFNAKHFIRHLRQCPWYSPSEMARCIPRRSLSGNVSWAMAAQRAATHGSALNLFFAKYLGAKRARHVHALAQIHIETGLLGVTVEGGKGAGKHYGPFYGRGYMQLTWAANYERYGAFRNLPEQQNPTYADARITASSVHAWSDGGAARRWAPRYDPAIVGTDMAHGAESAGQYWVSKSFRGTKNINRACDLGVSATAVSFISWLVNGGGNGHTNRQQFAEYLRNILLDAPLLSGSAILRHPSLAPPGNPALCARFPPVNTPYNQQLTVYYDRQIP
jgi:predicted chitinase